MTGETVCGGVRLEVRPPATPFSMEKSVIDLSLSTVTKPSEQTVRSAARSVPVRQLVRAAVITSAGFLIAILGNALFPQVSEKVELTDYAVGPFTLNMNGFYRLVLGAVIVIYLLAGLRAYLDPSRRPRYVRQCYFRFACGIALLAYDVLGTKLQVTPQPFFPGPAQILESFLMEPAYIGENVLYSLRLFGAGFLSGVLLGVGTGILIGWFPKVYYWTYPVLRITGVIPAVAWMPFALTLFPTPFAAATFLIAICSWFPVASQTAFGIQTTPRTQFEAARTLGADTRFLVLHVAIPHAMPQVFTGITTACASSFTTLVMAEMMGQPGGLGYYINVVKVWAAYYKVFAAILIMAILFSLILAVLGVIRAHVLRWQRGQFK